jgi:hypothetical protein
MSTVLISRLEEKMQLLLKKLQFLKEENQRLQATVEQQRSEIQGQRENIRELEQKVTLLNVAASARSDGDSSQELRKRMKHAINQYIREIDHCLTQLNE